MKIIRNVVIAGAAALALGSAAFARDKPAEKPSAGQAGCAEGHASHDRHSMRERHAMKERHEPRRSHEHK